MFCKENLYTFRKASHSFYHYILTCPLLLFHLRHLKVLLLPSRFRFELSKCNTPDHYSRGYHLRKYFLYLVSWIQADPRGVVSFQSLDLIGGLGLYDPTVFAALANVTRLSLLEDVFLV